MIFGTPGDFAIEMMLEPDLKPGSAAWGRARLWCQGVELGDYSREYCTVYGFYARIKELERDLEDLWSEEFKQLTDLELANKLDAILYGYHGDVPVPDEHIDGRPYYRYNFLTNCSEIFDGIGKTFVFSPSANEAFILHREGASVRRLVTTRESLRAAAKPFIKWFELENHKLNGAPLPA